MHLLFLVIFLKTRDKLLKRISVIEWKTINKIIKKIIDEFCNGIVMIRTCFLRCLNNNIFPRIMVLRYAR